MVRREIEMPVSPTRLWELLTDPASASSWFGATVEWTLEPGSPARFTGGEEGDRAGRLETVVPERQLLFRWWSEGDADDCSDVEYRLEPTGDGVRLTVTEQRVDVAAEACAAVPGARAGCAAAQGSAAWSTWDGRLAGVWCFLSSLPVAARVRA